MGASHVIVVGGGIFGATSAHALARRGHRVTLLEQGAVPDPLAASTDISKAVRLDYGHDDLYTALMEACLPTWERSVEVFGARLFHGTGFLFMSRAPLAPGGFEFESLRVLERRGHPFTRLNADALALGYPLWRASAYPDGYLNPRGGYVESGRVVRAYAQLAVLGGVSLREQAIVKELYETAEGVRGVVLASGERLLADRVVVALGAFTPLLLPELSPMLTSVGQPVFHFKPDQPDRFRGPTFPTWSADISTTGWYGFPANAEGLVKVAHHGAGRRLRADETREVGPDEEGRFREFLSTTFPALADAPIESTRLCLYCDTVDGDFLIDAVPGRDGLYVSTGGSGHAFKFAPMLGELTADVIDDRDNPFRRRFAYRTESRPRSEEARFTAAGS